MRSVFIFVMLNMSSILNHFIFKNLELSIRLDIMSKLFGLFAKAKKTEIQEGPMEVMMKIDNQVDSIDKKTKRHSLEILSLRKEALTKKKAKDNRG